jgi:hypothetical protein
MESSYTEAELLYQDIEKLIERAKELNATDERTRNLSLVITNLENAEDKMRRHIVLGE